jgi:hypothetical protein
MNKLKTTSTRQALLLVRYTLYVLTSGFLHLMLLLVARSATTLWYRSWFKVQWHCILCHLPIIQLSCSSCTINIFRWLLFRTIWSRCRDVVLEGRTIDLGKPWGGGKVEWGGGGQFTSNLGPGWTRTAPRKEEGFQVSRRESGERGVVKEN